MNKHICIISEGYPYEGYAYFPFVKQLCVALADLGWKVSVISPVSITKVFLHNNFPIPPKRRIERTDLGHIIEIYSPRILTVGNLCKFHILYHMMIRCKQNVILNIIKSMSNRPDVIYGHFWHSAFAGFKAAAMYSIPLFVASGEAEIELHKYYTLQTLKPFINYVKGVICVSSKNKNESVENKLCEESKIIVIPNGINKSLFYKKEKYKIRKKLGYSKNDFIVTFVGGFIYRKGAKRVSDAINIINDKEIKSIFIGRLLTKDTSELPNCNGILYRGSLPHEQVADYLNASDIFVMPTLHEGCCNAIVEAMSCGLPIISSNLSFNHDILNENNAILVDPMNVEEIANAIKLLYSNPSRREQMSQCSLAKAQDLTIERRALKIQEFIHDRLSIE